MKPPIAAAAMALSVLKPTQAEWMAQVSDGQYGDMTPRRPQ
jgi:hypothetical protein